MNRDRKNSRIGLAALAIAIGCAGTSVFLHGLVEAALLWGVAGALISVLGAVAFSLSKATKDFVLAPVIFVQVLTLSKAHQATCDSGYAIMLQYGGTFVAINIAAFMLLKIGTSSSANSVTDKRSNQKAAEQ